MFAYPDVVARPDTRIFEKPGSRKVTVLCLLFPKETGDTEPSPVSSPPPRYNRKEVRKKK